MIDIVLVSLLFAVLLLAAFLAGFAFGEKMSERTGKIPTNDKVTEQFRDASGAYSYKAARMNQSIEED